MTNKILAIVGMCGAGKSEAADHLTRKGYQFLRFGQITLDIVKKRYGEVNEKNEKKVREELRQEYGKAAFAKLNIEKIEDLLKKGPVVADGLYSWSEYKVLKERFGDKLKVLAVHAPPKVRYDRLENRSSENDEESRFRSFTREEAKERDKSEIENIEKAGPIAMADFMVVNTGTIDELKEKIDSVTGEHDG
ncbi:MAG: AAA family ATPase [Nanobdellota archaeon]